uniref:Uncharacterized protein n=1 Tax=Chenopodium quinoa TaxID=63459 RepID=A0A803MWY9_CHEQI
MSSPFSNTNTTTPNFDNLLLQSLMGRLQLRQQPPSLQHNHPLLSQSFEDLLLDAATNGGRLSDFSFSDDDDGDFSDGCDAKNHLSKEESKLEKELIKVILGGNTETLKPNSGQAVAIGEHHVCVGFHEENGSDYRVWEWHGHIMLFDEENGYTPEYIYGNYFERLMGGDSPGSRILHQSRNAGSPSQRSVLEVVAVQLREVNRWQRRESGKTRIET